MDGPPGYTTAASTIPTTGNSSERAGHGFREHGREQRHGRRLHLHLPPKKSLVNIFECVGGRCRRAYPNPISSSKKSAVYEQFKITQLLEKHYHDMQDCEFTIEGKLWRSDGTQASALRPSASRWTWPAKS